MPKLEIIRELPTVEYLRECFDYDAETGVLRWKLRPREHFARPVDFVRCNAMSGNAVGYMDGGYFRVSLGSVDYKVHRIVWKWMTGDDPPLMLDHRNGDRADNRWKNLRPAQYRDQTRNTKLRKDNAAGFRGVSPLKTGNGWRATIYTDGKQRYLGQFKTAQEASVVYEATARELFGEFYRQPQQR